MCVVHFWLADLRRCGQIVISSLSEGFGLDCGFKSPAKGQTVLVYTSKNLKEWGEATAAGVVFSTPAAHRRLSPPFQRSRRSLSAASGLQRSFCLSNTLPQQAHTRQTRARPRIRRRVHSLERHAATVGLSSAVCVLLTTHAAAKPLARLALLPVLLYGSQDNLFSSD